MQQSHKHEKTGCQQTDACSGARESRGVVVSLFKRVNGPALASAGPTTRKYACTSPQTHLVSKHALEVMRLEASRVPEWGREGGTMPPHNNVGDGGKM